MVWYLACVTFLVWYVLVWYQISKSDVPWFGFRKNPWSDLVRSIGPWSLVERQWTAPITKQRHVETRVRTEQKSSSAYVHPKNLTATLTTINFFEKHYYPLNNIN